jgi:hypothetical protein
MTWQSCWQSIINLDILMRKKLQEMAKQGMLPRRLSKCRVPSCLACLYANATKQPWQSNPKKNGNDGTKPTKPGQVVSVNQLVSPSPGLIAQMTDS